MKIEISLQNFFFQKRMCWMLSSLLQQKGDLPEIIVSISYPPINGTPSTEECIDFFQKKGLNILPLPLETGQEKNRSIARNMRAKDTAADWIIYADADMAFHPNQFEEFKKILQKEPYQSCQKVIGMDRHSLNIDFCMDYFNNDTREYPCVVENVADILSKWPVWYIGGKRVAPGFFQMASVKVIKEKGSIYCGGYMGTDSYNWKGDRLFRRHLGGVLPLDSYPLYHINHERTKGVQACTKKQPRPLNDTIKQM
jgi:glycosyltransferase involved in cell wall biosynthesis